jgi:peptidoglycan/xylan/chitin deacetylase (PgdA/CDA1 family)
LRYLPQYPQLSILNYHRIGDSVATPYDPSVFSTTAEEFDEQVAFLRGEFFMPALGEALAILDGQPVGRPAVLVTFDDGYRDNFEIAFPILRRHGATTVFFLTTSFVEGGVLPWWDSIAWTLRNAARRRFRLDYPASREFDIDAQGLNAVHRAVLRCTKTPPCATAPGS